MIGAGSGMFDWAEIEKIDAHMHILPDEVQRANPDADNEFQYAEAGLFSVLMRQFNIKSAVIMPFNDPRLMSMEFNIEAVHSNLFDLKQKSAGKFFAFADVDPDNSVEESCRFLIDAVEKYHLDGLKLHPQNSGLHIDSLYNSELLKTAEVLKLPVAIHSYPNTADSPDAVRNVVNLIDKFPQVTFIVSHMGAFQWGELLDCPAYVDISAILPDYVRKCGIEECRRMLHSFGADRLIFASDFPCNRVLSPKDIFTNYFEILNFMDFSENEAHQIAVANISSILKI